MKRIDAADDAVDSGGGKYVFADMALPTVPGTQLRAYWHTGVQEEIMGVIEGAGLTPDGSNNKQLVQAIKKPDAIFSNITLTVNGSAPYPKLVDAYNALQGRYIAPGVIVTIQLQTGMSHTMSTPLVVTNPYGEQIYINGNTTTPVLLTVTPTTFTREQAAITAINGGKIGRIQGVQLFYDTANPVTFPVFGIRAGKNGYVKLSQAFDANSWRGSGVIAEDGGIIEAELSARSRNNNVSGFALSDDIATYGIGWHARNRGIIRTNTSVALGNGNFSYLAERGGMITAISSSATSVGYCARQGGFLRADTCTAIVAGSEAGFFSTSGSYMHCYQTVSGDTSLSNKYGYLATFGATMYLDGAQAKYCTNDGVFADTGSSIVGPSCASSNNTLYGFHAGNRAYIGITIPTYSANGTANFLPAQATNGSALNRID